MSASESQKPGGAGDGEKRVRCLYCGANNFPSSPTCWQCGRPLQSLRAPDPAPASSPLGRPFSAQAVPPQGRAAASAHPDSVLAPKAAAALGMMFPYIGLPVGIVFLMLDDPRKTQIGWITIGWSVAGTVISGLLLIPLMASVLAFFKGFVPHGGQGGGLPGIPGLPSAGGDPENINILLLALWRHAILPNLQAFGHRFAFCAPGNRV